MGAQIHESAAALRGRALRGVCSGGGRQGAALTATEAVGAGPHAAVEGEGHHYGEDAAHVRPQGEGGAKMAKLQMYLSDEKDAAQKQANSIGAGPTLTKMMKAAQTDIVNHYNENDVKGHEGLEGRPSRP